VQALLLALKNGKRTKTIPTAICHVLYFHLYVHFVSTLENVRYGELQLKRGSTHFALPPLPFISTFALELLKAGRDC
jgi:hypothetical protein